MQRCLSLRQRFCLEKFLGRGFRFRFLFLGVESMMLGSVMVVLVLGLLSVECSPLLDVSLIYKNIYLLGLSIDG